MAEFWGLFVGGVELETTWTFFTASEFTPESHGGWEVGRRSCPCYWGFTNFSG